MSSESEGNQQLNQESADIPANYNSDQALIIGSEKLFENKKTVFISHNGSWYKLMITKQNKLILTK